LRKFDFLGEWESGNEVAAQPEQINLKPTGKRSAELISILTALIVAGASVFVSVPPLAQVVGIAAVVNDEIVSAYDVDQRLRLIISTSGMRDTKEIRDRMRGQALRSLIDDRLRIQEANRLNLKVTSDDLVRAKRHVEKRNKIPSGGFEDFLKAQGVGAAAVKLQMTAEISWSKVMGRRLRPQVQISDEDIDEMLARYQKTEGLQERLLAEIFLAVDRSNKSGEVRRTAERLVKQIRQGAPFGAISRQFSQGVSSNQGGDVGWVTEGQLSAEVEEALRQMRVGTVSQPIETPEGFYIILLRNSRRVGAADPQAAIVELKQVALPIASGTSQTVMNERLDLAKSIAGTVNNCAAIEQQAKDLGYGDSANLGKMRVGDLPVRFRSVVASLPIGQASKPLRTEQGYHVLMVCARKEAEIVRPNRDVVRESLGQQRLSMMARRYMRNLRRNAVIELR